MKNFLQRVDTSSRFKLKSQYLPTGDQPGAIARLVKNIEEDAKRQVLLGVTGSGKTYTIANVIEKLNRPTLVLSHNKTLAAQLYSEFTEFFPDNAVRYFVSYFDYYQPEAYIPSTDTYIEKDSAINDEIDKLRHAATKALLERRDVIVVASVSCIYGLGDPQNYFDLMIYLEEGDVIERNLILKKLVELQYTRNDEEFLTGTFRVMGDVVDICPASESEKSIRLEFFGDEIEQISEIDRITGRVYKKIKQTCIYPASHFVSNKEAVKKAIGTIKQELKPRLKELNEAGKTLEAARLEQRTLYDLEMLNEMGFCSGIENYSRHLTGHASGEPPPTLIDYFPDDFLVVIDESHVTVPQLVGMYRGDRSRKSTLVEHGFRLPSALDNRPLRFDEFEKKVGQLIYVSATPSDFEVNDSGGKIVEQIIRPTGLLDPVIEIRPASNQVDDFLHQVNEVSKRGERALVTTLTKKMAEHLSDYYTDLGVKVRYLHSEVKTLERLEIIKALRNGEFDLLIGINLLREGLDLPEVSLVGIMDADKEGFLRSKTSLIQTIGRAARNLNGRVILYADRETDSIRAAVSETNRRRIKQESYNKANNIDPKSVIRAKDVDLVQVVEVDLLPEIVAALTKENKEIPKDIVGCKKLIQELQKEMFVHAKNFEFESAAVIRDRIIAIEKFMLSL